MANIFKGQSDLTISLETGTDLTGATGKVLCIDPAGTKMTLSAAISGTKVVYNCVPGDFNIVGIWQLQAFTSIGGLHGFGQIVKLTVDESLQ